MNEIYEMIQGKLDYFKDFWNIFNLIETASITVVFIFSVFDYQGVWLPIIASLLAFVMIMNLFYWSRID